MTFRSFAEVFEKCLLRRIANFGKCMPVVVFDLTFAMKKSRKY